PLIFISLPMAETDSEKELETVVRKKSLDDEDGEYCNVDDEKGKSDISSVIQERLQERDVEKPKEMFLCLGPEVSVLGLSAVLEFAYTGVISDLNRESLPETQTAAFSLGVPRVLELCKGEEEMKRKQDRQQMEDNRKTSATEQMKVSLQSVRQLWDNRVGCDVKLEAEGRKFHGK
uniref:BTB domain-containing protein n=1 Tax=Electrophorus electricus TaxID=8005 RepID=A0AAY5E863_ELEEL